MKYKLSIEVLCESKQPSVFEQLGFYYEPLIEFDRLDDLIALLHRVADVTGVEPVREYAERVKLEGEATERAVRRWGNRKDVTLEGEIKKAITAATAKQKTAKK